MIVILASAQDAQARTLAERWQAEVITPADLSRAGWCFELPGSAPESLAVASGRLIRTAEISGVLTRIASVLPGDLPGIAAEDRPYVATEMHAFLAAWLDALECPVLNRPAPNCLCGPVERLPNNEDEGDSVSTVVGYRCFGDQRAAVLARQAGIQLLAVRFRDGEMLGAHLVPDLSNPDIAEAVHALLSAEPPAASRPAEARLAPASTPRIHSQILLWGLPADGPLCRVHEELQLLDAPVRLLDQREVLETRFCCDRIHFKGLSLPLDEVRSVYIRCYDSTQLPHIRDASEADRRYAAEIDARITRWIQTTPAFVVNPLEAMSANNSKPFQSRWIAQFGWRIPRTLITTDPAAARIFWRTHREVIYKSISSIRSQVARLTAAHEHRFDDVVNCPTQFQEFIPGVDYRVHVVGSEIFSSRVDSNSDDYRYGDAEFAATRLPPEIEERCRVMSAAMGLPLSGIDLRLTPEGEWVCFEVNPSPAFTAYEDETGQPITAAVARLLLHPPAA